MIIGLKIEVIGEFDVFFMDLLQESLSSSNVSSVRKSIETGHQRSILRDFIEQSIAMC
jgi:hypothetical protein